MCDLPWEEAGVSNDDGLWKSYMDAMRTVMVHQRGLGPKKKALDESQRAAVEHYLLSNRTLVPLEVSSGHIRDKIIHQKDRFIESTGFSSRQIDYLTRCLCYLGDSCAKNDTALPLAVAWRKMKEIGLAPRENCISTYMYVLGLDERLRKDCAEVATYHDALFEPNEKTVYLRIRSAIWNGDAEAAESVLSSLPDKGKGSEWKRLRTFVPILSYYCETGEMGDALRLFRQMRESDGVLLDDDTYVLLLSALAHQGALQAECRPIQGAAELNFSACGPALFDEITAAMTEDLLEISEANARTLYHSLVQGLARESLMVETSSESDIVPVAKHFDNRLVIGRVSVDNTTAICPETQVKLKLCSLTDMQRRNVQDTLFDMAAKQHEAHSEKMESASGSVQEHQNCGYAVSALSNFSHWISHREGEPFTAIVDGPNVAYHGHGHFHYSQVKKVVQALERMGERPLVVMPQKYVASSFWLSSLRCKQTLSPADLEIMNGLTEKGMMYAVPKSCLDDYYWMLASVANQTTVKGLFIPVDDHNGRFPGLRPMIITNDLMRDHRLQLLAARPFRRWTSCHIVNYVIEPYDDDEYVDRSVQFFPADSFSREIQGNPSPSYPEQTVWHFPVTEWSESDRLCVSIHS